jgi:hypothetical protein
MIEAMVSGQMFLPAHEEHFDTYKTMQRSR